MIEFTSPTPGRLDPAAITTAAASCGWPRAALAAVLDVETSGAGFDSQSRPKMLFEPHIFWGQLRKDPDASKLNRAIAAKLAYPHWGQMPYPPDSYPRLIAACAIDETAALSSASWGIGQVMGFNWKDCGFDSVQDLVAAAIDSEAAQLDTMTAFIQAKPGLSGDLVDMNWPYFAQGYNGPGQVAVYSQRLRTAYAKECAAA